jgi:hypothetical protein
MSCTLYVERLKGRIKVDVGRILLYGENFTVHGIPLLHDKVKITVDDVVEGCKHIIIPFSAGDKEWIGDMIQTPFIWPIELVQLVEPVIN